MMWSIESTSPGRATGAGLGAAGAAAGAGGGAGCCASTGRKEMRRSERNRAMCFIGSLVVSDLRSGLHDPDDSDRRKRGQRVGAVALDLCSRCFEHAGVVGGVTEVGDDGASATAQHAQNFAAGSVAAL